MPLPSLVCVFSCLMFHTLLAAEEQKPAKKPNIVFIMTDHMGWGDLGYYGGGRIEVTLFIKIKVIN